MAYFGSDRARRQLTGVVLALVVGAAAVACSSGSGPKSVSLRSNDTTPAAASSDTSAPAGVSGSAPASPVGGQATTAPPASGGATTHPVAPTATTGPAAATVPAPAATSPKVTAPPSNGPAPITPGSYHYSASGSTTLTTSKGSTALPATAQTLAVTSTASSSSEQWNPSAATATLAFNNSGVFLTSETVPLVSTTCTFASPMPSPPWPPAVGKSFSGQATCGSSALSLSGRIAGTASMTVAGASVATYTVVTDMTLSGSNLAVEETDWYAPSLRVPVKTTVTVSGSSGTSSISSNVTYLLTSAGAS